MSSIEVKNLSKGDKGRKMNDVLETHELFIQAFPERRYGSVKDMLCAAVIDMNRRVSKKFTYRRARTIWEKTARRIDGEEKDAFRQAIIEEDRREQKELRARLAALDARLAPVDQEFTSPALAAYREATRRAGPHAR